MPDPSEGQPPPAGELFRLLADSLTDHAVVVTDADRRVRTWTAGAERVFGWRAGEAVGRLLDRIFTPEDIAAGAPEAEAGQALATGRATDDRWHVRKDGTRFWASGVLTALRDPDGTFRGFAKVLRDLTAQKRAEEALRDQEELLRTLGDNLPDGAIYQAVRAAAGGPTRFTYVSAGIRRLVGVAPEEILADPAALFGLILPDDLPRVIAAEDAAAAALGPFDCEFRQRARDGRVVWVHARSAPRLLAGGAVAYEGLLLDVTARRHAEDALREADRRKDEFLATLAHELRNPLAPVRSALQVIRLAEDRPTRERARELMERQIGQLARLVDDLMDVARVSRGKVVLRTTRVDLGAAAAEAAEAVRPVLDARGHRLEVDLPAAPVWVEADAARLAQVLTNLLQNAAKYTPDGGAVRLAVAREGAEAVARVSDTGVGIAPEALPRVFELFAQADRSLDRADGGLGIGLTLVRRLVELHGGTVEAASDGHGRGSAFTVRLPAAAPGPVPAPVGGEPATGGRRRVLVVDDNVDAADSLGMLLEMLGHDVRTAHDGPAALAAVAADRPDVVLLDLGMPGMDGYETARRLRARPEGARLWLVALTGWGAEDDRRKTREAGFDHHLVKPVDTRELLAYLAGVGGERV